MAPLDSFRRRVYIAPLGLWLTLDSGAFENIEVNKNTHAVRVGLAAATPFVTEARLRIEQPAKQSGIGTFRPEEKLAMDRDTFATPLKSGETWITLTETE